MTIESIERIGKTKFHIKGTMAESFVLSIKELKELGLYFSVCDLLGDSEIKENLEVNLSDESYDIINKEVVIPRGKRYALSLLSDRDYTVKGLREKLISAGYNMEHQDIIISYIKSFNYVDDVRYATNYIRSKETSKTRRYIEDHLKIKGVSSADIKEAYEQVASMHELDGIDEMSIKNAALEKAFDKKLKPQDYGNKEKITKVMQSLIREGFNYSDIKDMLSKKCG